MQENDTLNYLFIVNPGSGRNDANLWKEEIHSHFKEKPHTYSIYILPKGFKPEDISGKIDEIAPQHVIAVGGDGTVTMLANMLLGKNIPLGIMPAGSANGMARELGIPEIPEQALEIITAGYVKAIDRISINEKYFCLHLADIGLNARLIKYFDEGKLRGKLGYSRVVLKTLLNRKKIYALIRNGNDVRTEIVYMIVIANASMYGTGAVINPEGNPGDGHFEVIMVKSLSFSSLFKMLFRPSMFNPKHIEICSCTSVNITTTRPVDLQVDGEYLGKEKEINARIEAGKVKMIVPRNKGINADV